MLGDQVHCNQAAASAVPYKDADWLKKLNKEKKAVKKLGTPLAYHNGSMLTRSQVWGGGNNVPDPQPKSIFFSSGPQARIEIFSGQDPQPK